MEEAEHQDHLHKPIYGLRRNPKNTHFPEAESMSQHYYSLRQNPKKKTHESFELESPESLKKILFRCEECGKGFRYEKCFSNHQEMVHSPKKQRVYEEEEETMESLYSSFSLVKKKKRSRVTRYKKTSLSFSFTTFLEPRSVFDANDEEFEVAECLILLSKSSPKFDDGLKLVAEAMDVNPETPQGRYDSGCLRNKKPRKAGVLESGLFSNEQELVEERVSRYKTSKEQASEFETDQQNVRKAAEFESKQILLKEGMTTDDTFKGEASFLGHKSDFERPKLPKGSGYGIGILEERVGTNESWKEPASFLGEMRKSSDFEASFSSNELGVKAMQCSDSDTEIFTESNKENYEHKCKLCNKVFSSYQSLGGHQTYHRLQQSKTKKNHRYKSVEEPGDELVNKEEKRHTCNICSRRFKSVHALGGHKRQHSKTKDDHQQDLRFLSSVPVSFNNLSLLPAKLVEARSRWFMLIPVE